MTEQLNVACEQIIYRCDDRRQVIYEEEDLGQSLEGHHCKSASQAEKPQSELSDRLPKKNATHYRIARVRESASSSAKSILWFIKLKTLERSRKIMSTSWLASARYEKSCAQSRFKWIDLFGMNPSWATCSRLFGVKYSWKLSHKIRSMISHTKEAKLTDLYLVWTFLVNRCHCRGFPIAWYNSNYQGLVEKGGQESIQKRQQRI